MYRKHWSIAVLKTRQVLPGPPNLREGIFLDLFDFGSVFLGVAAQAAVLCCCWLHTPGGYFSSLFFFFLHLKRALETMYFLMAIQLPYLSFFM